MILRLRTHERFSFRRCRRKWDLESFIRQGLSMPEEDKPHYFWFGTGIHFALEDFHGYNYYGSPSNAWLAYVTACRNSPTIKLPVEAPDLIDTGREMMEYYEEWLVTHPTMQTLWVDNRPCVEFYVEVPLDVEIPPGSPFTEVRYCGTIDRVGIDEYGILWPYEYKAYAQQRDNHIDMDGQVTAYSFLLQQAFPDHPVGGMIYQQHIKSPPQPPTFLKTKGMFSVAKNQRTTSTLYRKALQGLYGEVTLAPRDNVQFLNWLTEQESLNEDRYIIRTPIQRTKFSIEAEIEKIRAEVWDMLNPNLKIYPNPTGMCGWDCWVKDVCVAMDNGEDWESQVAEIQDKSESRREIDESWQTYLPKVA